VVPDLEKILLPQHVHFARHLGALTQPRMDEHAPLRVQLGDLPVEVHAIEKLHPRRMRGGHLCDPALDVEPDRHRVDPHRVAGQAGHIEFPAVRLLDRRPKRGRHLEPAAIVDFCRRVPP
jgi:hypothetical protein